MLNFLNDAFIAYVSFLKLLELRVNFYTWM